MTADLKTLAERVEGLQAPCRETDGDIAEALGLPPADLERCSRRRGFWYRQVADADFDTWDAPAYTASLDAVLALIGEKLPEVYHSYERTALRPGMIPGSSPWPYRGLVGGWGTPSRGYGHTPALALLAAALRAIGESHDR